MRKTLTITTEADVLQWAREVAKVRGQAVAQVIRDILNNEMHGSRRYWLAYEDWKKLSAKGLDIDMSQRLTREQIHERR